MSEPESEYVVHLRVVNKLTGESSTLAVELTRTEIMELIAEGAIPSEEFLSQLEGMEPADPGGVN